MAKSENMVKAVKKEKRGLKMDMHKFTKFINIVLLTGLVYTYIQLAVIQTEYRMYKEYNQPTAGATMHTSKPNNLPPILDLK